MKNVFILGNGSTGTSFLFRSIASHPKVTGDFEPFDKTFNVALSKYKKFARSANDSGHVWLGKLPFERAIFRRNDWEQNDFLKLGKEFFIIGTYREFDSWFKSWNYRQEKIDEKVARQRWQSGNQIIEGLRNQGRVLTVVNYHRLVTDFDKIMTHVYNLIGIDALHKPIERPDRTLNWVNEVNNG